MAQWPAQPAESTLQRIGKHKTVTLHVRRLRSREAIMARRC
jgi:hypothetical protein